jgi:uncharacterized protein
MLVGTVARLFRYPVKSMRGEEISATQTDFHGVLGDRRWAFVQAGDTSYFPWLTARETAQMLLYRPRYAAEPETRAREPALSVEAPDGRIFAVDDPELRAELERLAETPLFLLHSFRAVPDIAPFSLFNLALAEEIGAQAGSRPDPRRFRANIYMQPTAEPISDAALVGRTLAIGPQLRLAVLALDQRCKMITLDPDTAERSPALLHTVVKEFANCAGVHCAVLQPGPLAVGDAIVVEE